MTSEERSWMGYMKSQGRWESQTCVWQRGSENSYTTTCENSWCFGTVNNDTAARFWEVCPYCGVEIVWKS